VNRKLIRTTLADVKAKGRDAAVQPREQRVNGSPARPSGSSSGDGGGSSSGGGGGAAAQRAAQAAAVQVRKRTPPPTETSAEIFYYKKQIDAHTSMVITLQDGEEIEGTIEWYDRNAIKVNRKGSPNLLILKHNIKYMYKADEREGE
jgi:sRNA-binding regulator protein Hfq